jgi:hypothetical protein
MWHMVNDRWQFAYGHISIEVVNLLDEIVLYDFMSEEN